MADVFFYDALTTGDADGTTWEDAYQDLQTAIDALASGDVLRCKGGTITLTARIDFDNSNDNEIVGGYDTSLTGTTVPTTRDLPADITILDGVDTYRCMRYGRVGDGPSRIQPLCTTASFPDPANSRLDRYDPQPFPNAGCCRSRYAQSQ